MSKNWSNQTNNIRLDDSKEVWSELETKELESVELLFLAQLDDFTEIIHELSGLRSDFISISCLVENEFLESNCGKLIILIAHGPVDHVLETLQLTNVSLRDRLSPEDFTEIDQNSEDTLSAENEAHADEHVQLLPWHHEHSDPNEGSQNESRSSKDL